jgi:hypothetical protein
VSELLSTWWGKEIFHTGQTSLVTVYKTFVITQEASHDRASEDPERNRERT